MMNLVNNLNLTIIEFEMPDKYMNQYVELNIIDTLIERLKTDVDTTIIVIIKTLTRLATKSKNILSN